MTDRTHISFLLGAGFSKPAGYPLAREINERFIGLKESDITIHTDGSAWFNNGKPNPNDRFMQKTERLFIERLLAHYCNCVESPSSFHYEKFYDWYKDLRDGRTVSPDVDDIAAGVQRETGELSYDTGNLLLKFDLTFNQLLAQLLTKRYPEVHLCNGPPAYDRFLDLVQTLSQAHILHFHSLNHDIFFETLSKTDAIHGELADGFTELGSPYYATLERFEDGSDGKDLFTYTVRLPRFVNRFENRFNLYKLHGSINQYNFRDKARGTVRTMWGVGPNSLMKEVEEDGKLRYEEEWGNYHPDFLSGTTFKTLRYNSTRYYQAMFKHFEVNLERSRFLVVIGYGFGDEEINRMIEERFLNDSESRIFVVDVTKPDLPPGIEERSQFFGGGVSSFDPAQLSAALSCQNHHPTSKS